MALVRTQVYGRCATLSKNILMSNAKDFYEFTRKQQLETARRSNKDIPGVHVFFLESDEVEEAKNSYLQARSEKLRTAGGKTFSSILNVCFI